MKNQTTLLLTSESLSFQRDNPIHVFGHRNPDSNAICSALVVADWLNYTGRPTTPWHLGDITPETRHILNIVDVSQSDLLIADLTDKIVWLVDFTDAGQGPSSLMGNNVTGIIDRHRIGTLITRNPPNVWVQAVGCCRTIIPPILIHDIPIPITVSQAVLLMGAILSDTVALTGPTTTTQDQETVTVLREIAGIDYDQLVTGLLHAKTDITGQSTSTLLSRDAKNYRIHDVPLLLSQIEVRGMADVTSLLPALLQEMDKTCKNSSLDMVILMVTDITNQNSALLFSDSSLTGSFQISLPGMTSREKEILPWLTDHFAFYKR